MEEVHFKEVEKVLLYLSDARTRAQKAGENVANDGADAHVVEALRETERQLGELHRKLSQGTYYAEPGSSPNRAV